MKDFKLHDFAQEDDPFVIPEAYFEAFPERLQSKLKDRPVVPLYKKTTSWYVVAAMVLIAVVLPTPNTSREPATLDEATLENYLAYESGLTQYDLLNLLESDALSELDEELPLDDTVIEDGLISSGNLEQLIIE